MVRRCMNHLKKKEYELNITQARVDEAVRVTRVVNKNYANGATYAGKHVIQINTAYWQHDKTKMVEYKAFNSDPVIGQVNDVTEEEQFMLTVAHEVSHHVQYTVCRSIPRFKSTFRKAHGKCFQSVYRYLRRDLVNPIIEKRKSNQPKKEEQGMSFSKSFGTVVHVKIETPTYIFKDKELSQELAKIKGEEEKTLSASVNIFGKQSKPLENIISIGKKARIESDKYVLGKFWDQKVMSANAVWEHEKSLRHYQDIFKAEVNSFLANLDKLKADAVAESKGVVSLARFAEKGFGSVEEVAERFVFRIQYLPIPERNPFDAEEGLDIKGTGQRELSEALKKQNDQINSQLDTLQTDMKSAKYERLADLLGKFNKGCNGDGQIKIGTYKNLEEYLVMHKAMNIDNDENYTNLIKSIVDVIKPYSHEATKDDVVRDELANKTKPILDQLAVGYG